MAITGITMSDNDRRAQKEWVFKLKSTATLLSRSAIQAQRNFDQYLTAMEHVAALYKDYGALLSAAKQSFLGIQADIPDLSELKASTARMHSIVHKWEHSEALYAVRAQLHTQTDVLKSRSQLAAKALEGCAEREELTSTYVMKSAKLARRLKKQSPEAEELQKECDKLERRLLKVHATAQRDVDTVAVKSSASLKELTALFFKGMYKNGAYLEKHFHPDRIGQLEESAPSAADLLAEDAVTGVFGSHRSPRSENSSIAASGIYGQNRNRFQPHEAQHRLVATAASPQNSGIPLRYDADAAAAAAAENTNAVNTTS